MQPVYRSAPTTTCNAPAKSFSRPLEALQHARDSADGFRVGYAVYRTLAGRLRCLGRFTPDPARA